MIPQLDTQTLPSLLPPRLKWLMKPSAVVSSKGERGKPSRGTSERRERRELETLWSLSSFKWKQLHRPPVPFLFPASSSPLYPSHPISPHSVPPPSRSLFLVLSAPRLLASKRNVAVLLTPQQTLDSFVEEI